MDLVADFSWKIQQTEHRIKSHGASVNLRDADNFD